MNDFTKDPDAELDFTRDWSDWLTAVGDTIATSTWTVPDDLVIGTNGQTNDAMTATVWIKGGTAGRIYRVTNRITTDGGRTDDRSFTLTVRHR